MKKKTDTWGWHLLLDCADFDSHAINDVPTIRNFVSTLVKDIDMVPIGDVQIIWCDTHEDQKKGYTFIQVIETSNIIGHLCSYDNTGFIDVFSCKPFDPQIVLDLVEVFFGQSTRIRWQWIERVAPR